MCGRSSEVSLKGEGPIDSEANAFWIEKSVWLYGYILKRCTISIGRMAGERQKMDAMTIAARCCPIIICLRLLPSSICSKLFRCPLSLKKPFLSSQILPPALTECGRGWREPWPEKEGDLEEPTKAFFSTHCTYFFILGSVVEILRLDTEKLEEPKCRAGSAACR